MTEFYNTLTEWVRARPFFDRQISKSAPIHLEHSNIFAFIEQFKIDAIAYGWSSIQADQVVDYALAGMENRPSESDQFKILVLLQSYYSIPLKLCGHCGEVTSRVLCHKCTNPK